MTTINPSRFQTLRHWLVATSLSVAFASIGTADVTLTATSSAGTTPLTPGSTFTVNLTWSGTPTIAATEYNVTLNTNLIACNGRSFDNSLPYADNRYISSFPVLTDTIDVTWYKNSGFMSKDMTLTFQVPQGYTGPSVVSIGATLFGVQDSTATAIPATVVGTTVQIVNEPPSISDVANQTINEDAATAALPILIGDTETPVASLTMSGSSSNTTLVPDANIVFAGSGANRTVTVTPAANQNGTATITLTVTDGGGLTATDTFLLTVNPVNDPPTISNVADQTVAIGANTGALPFTVSDDQTAVGSLTLTGSSSNQTLVPNSNIVFGGSGASRTVTVTPVAGLSGTSTITLTVNDGTLSASDTFLLTVSNDPVKYTWSGTPATTGLVWGTLFPTATARDIAVIDPTAAGDLSISLGASGATNTIGIIDVNAQASNSLRIGFTGSTRETGRKFIFNNGTQTAAIYSDLEGTPSNPPSATGPSYLRFELSAAIEMQSDLLIRLKTQRDFSLYDPVTESGGSKKLTVDISDSQFDNTFRKINFATTNTYSGGTELIANNITGTGTPRIYAFYAQSANSLGSGLLTLQSAILDIRADHTVGGLSSSGTTAQKQAAKIVAENTTATRTLTLDFNSSTYTYDGLITNGTLSGTATYAGVIQLVKTGTGTQVLTGANTYTGTTAVNAGGLLVNGSLTSAVTVGASGTLGGTGAINAAVTNGGTIAPGSGGVGALTAGALTLSAGSSAQIELSNWTGSTAGTHWDTINCASLALAGTTGSKITLKLLPNSLANFSEASKTFTIATSAAAITGFAANAIAIDSTSMPGAGTWAPQLDATSKLLQVVYTPSAGYTTWQGEKFTPAQISAGLAAADADPDHDGYSNLAEFAFNGEPLSPSSKALVVTEQKDTGTDGNKELVFTCAVRRGAVFSANGNNAQVSAAIDGIVYRIEATADLGGSWNSAVTPVGAASNTPPAGSGLPVLTTGWEYRTFSSFNGLPTRGFMRAVATQP